jgi:hypothetical protein
VPVNLVRTEVELGWCVAWKHTMTTRLAGRRSITVVRVPVGEWERRADIPIGLWAPELTAGRLLGIADVARLAGHHHRLPVTAAHAGAGHADRRQSRLVPAGHRTVAGRPAGARCPHVT